MDQIEDFKKLQKIMEVMQKNTESKKEVQQEEFNETLDYFMDTFLDLALKSAEIGWNETTALFLVIKGVFLKGPEEFAKFSDHIREYVNSDIVTILEKQDEETIH